MKTNRTPAIVAGVLYIVAAVTSIIALLLYDPILNHADFIVGSAEHDNQVIWGALLELILAVSAVIIAITLFPLLKKQNESVALGYMLFRFFEAVLIVVGVIGMLSVLTLREKFAAGAVASDAPAFLASGKLLVAVHDWTFLLGPNFMLGINTMMCACLLYRTRLVPRIIGAMGMIGATLIFTASLFEMFGVFTQVSAWGMMMAVPVAAYEMSLAVWLIVKGFNPSSPVFRKSAAA